ncbi:MAG: hypothetical protein ACLFS2_03655 [Halochromatium sp.]|uniref:hypothetical protein n=1 Tax=Halochromatium sp. TaxID=2049430 RepID=UPI0039791F46
MTPNATPQMAGVIVPATYRDTWHDGFGARGWKLDCSLTEPSVIASTSETGSRLPTSVLVHDILDHHLCGVGIGGHRNEAIALHQLEIRTGSDPLPDIRQIINEDLLQGCVERDTMRSFLPSSLLSMVPHGVRADYDIIKSLRNRLTHEQLLHELELHFIRIGQTNSRAAKKSFEESCLFYEKRTSLGIAIQDLLIAFDQYLASHSVDYAHGAFYLTNDHCTLRVAGLSSAFYADVK